MSAYAGPEDYWQQPPQGHYNFDASGGFGQPNQQFEFQSYAEQQGGDYSSFNQKPYLDPTQNIYGNDVYGQDDFTKGKCNELTISLLKFSAIKILFHIFPFRLLFPQERQASTEKKTNLRFSKNSASTPIVSYKKLSRS